jgi:S-DNA-T family DNA segregation ATPase FtsK/SpoIIIE
MGKAGAYLANLIVYQGFDLLLFCLFVCFFKWNLSYCWDIIKKLKGIWFWDLFARRDLCSLWLFFTLLPELGGVVGYELNLFLQDYLGKQELYWYHIWIDYLCYF